MSESEQHKRSMSRRSMLAGAGAAAVGAGVVGSVGIGSLVSAQEAGDQNVGAPQAGPAEQLIDPSFLAAAPNPKQLILNTLSFVPVNAQLYDYVVPGGVTPRSGAGSDWWNCPIDLPAGSTIQSLALHLNPAGSARGFYITRYNMAVPAYATVVSGSSGSGSAPTTATIASINHVVLPSPWAYRIDNLSLSNPAAVYGATVTYLPPPAGYIPVSPVQRVYNSRDSALPKFGAGEERTIALSPHVPNTAQAAVLNLTVTQTVGGGFAAVFPADVAWPGNSSINWSTSNQDVANMVLTQIDSSAQIKIRAGASTHVIVDVVGYITQ